MPNHQKLKTMVKRRKDQKLRLRNFDARHWKIETGAVVKNRKGLSGVEKGQGEKASVREETSAVSGLTLVGAQNQYQKMFHPLSHQHKEVEVRREKKPSKVGVRLGSPIDSRAKTSWKVFALNYLVTIWNPPECQFNKAESGCKFGNKCSFSHRKVEEQANRKLEEGWWQNAVVVLKNVQKFGCVFQDSEPTRSSSFLRKGTKVLGPIRRVQFTKATQRHADIREIKGPSLGKIQEERPELSRIGNRKGL